MRGVDKDAMVLGTATPDDITRAAALPEKLKVT